MRLPRFFGFSARPTGEEAYAGWRGMDFHSHLLPAVDDGMADLEESKTTIAALQSLGFAGAVLTPHVYKDVFDNNAASLRRSFNDFTAALAADHLAFPLYLAAEYFADEHFLQLLSQDDVLALDVGGERWVLIEFPYLQETPFVGPCLSALRARGYRPVIAHVERYRFVAQAPAIWLQRFADAGAVLQGDIGSLVGQFGPPIQKFALWLLERGNISIWGTDVHHAAQVAKHVAPGLARLGKSGRLNTMLDALMSPVTA
jgi:tyrosine-protein phosphatase YwqE